MSVSVFVLNVEEFEPIVTHAKTREDIVVTGPTRQGYYRLDAKEELTLNRRTLALKPAVWHGLLTGGLVGKIKHFDNDDLVLIEESA